MGASPDGAKRSPGTCAKRKGHRAIRSASYGLVYCFTLFGTYASDRVMAANRASFPRYAGEGRDGGVFANRAPSLASPPSPLPPRFALPPWPGEGAD